MLKVSLPDMQLCVCVCAMCVHRVCALCVCVCIRVCATVLAVCEGSWLSVPDEETRCVHEQRFKLGGCGVGTYLDEQL